MSRRAAPPSRTEATRASLLDAADRVIAERGVAGLTTKEVARAAGRSEGSIYNHFEDKLALVSAVVTGRVDEVRASYDRLVPGEGDLRERLVGLVAEQLRSRRELMALESGVIGDPELRERYQAWLRDLDKGPHRGHERLAGYLAAEQDLGRLPAGLDPAVVAFLLIAATREAAHLELIVGADRLPLPEADLPRRIVDQLLGPADGSPLGTAPKLGRRTRT